MPVPYILSDPYLDANFAWTKDGTVKSVGLSAPNIFTVSNSPVTTSGTLTFALNTQSANLIFAGPSTGAAASPTFRAIVTNDLPDSGVSAATYGSNKAIPQITFDAKGRATAASNLTIAPSLIFAQTSTVTVTNTTVETTLLGSGVGSLVFAANSLQIGSSVSGTAIGPHSTSGNPTIQLRVYMNSTVILDTGIVTSGNSASATWEFRGFITCRSTGVTGTVQAQGFYIESAGGTNLFGMVNSAPITIDTTIAQTFNFTVQWGTASASNTISNTNTLVQAWGPPQ